MNDIQTVAAWLKSAKRVVAFTGAGISTESGIPDFRSPGGVWATNQPVYYHDFVARADARQEYWRQKSIAHKDFADSDPNDGHQTLAKWESKGLLQSVITQNIDGLHQDAGSTDVVELHGTARFIACLNCGYREGADRLVQEFLDTEQVPACPECRGILKHATISFGQALDQEVLSRAMSLAAEADLLLAMGSSLVVYPAAAVPQIAKQHGARLVIINRDPTEQDRLADVVINASIGASLVAIDRALEELND